MAWRKERLLLPPLLLVLGILMLNEGNRIAAREMMIDRDPREVQARVKDVEERVNVGSRGAPNTYTLHVTYDFSAPLPTGGSEQVSGRMWLKTKNRYALQPGDPVRVTYSGLQPTVHRPAAWADTASTGMLILRVLGGLMLAAFFAVVALMFRA